MKLVSILLAVLAGTGTCVPSREPASFDATHYASQLQKVAARRAALSVRYEQAHTAAARAAVVRQARQVLLASLDSVIWPAWYGTPWAFYGTTETPQHDSIACGYFVTTTLRDAGLRLNRVALAKTTSEKLIQNLTDEAHIRRYRLVPQQRFVAQVQQLGDGLYIVGLDFHVGFLRVKGKEVRFIHSTYLGNGAVVNEEAATSKALRSKYRVLGRLSADSQLLKAWLTGRRFVFPA